MNDEKAVQRGFWTGIALLFLGAALGGFCLAQGRWIQAALNLLITVPFSIWGLKSNRESYMLQGKIEELKKWSLL